MKKLYIGDWNVSNAMLLDGEYVYTPFNVPFEVELLVVAGGGGGGQEYTDFLPYTRGGGGGAGGMVTGSFLASINDTYTMSIGNGGAGADASEETTNGSNSTFSSGSNIVTANGGGGGANPRYQSDTNGNAGGSGGGAGTQSGALGTAGLETTGTSNFGTFTAFGEQGGTGAYCGTGQLFTGGGGGGAGSPGSQTQGGCSTVSGAGLQLVDGITYAVGGGNNGGAIANRGYGGDPKNGGSAVGDSGSSGIVKLRYKGLQKATGGTITESGGYIYHTFTSADTFSVYSTVDA